MPHVVVLATGGTIASRRSSEGGARASDTGEELIAGLDGLPADLTIETRDLAVANSYNFGLGDLASIGRAAQAEAARPGVDGVVVTHGTDAIEETAAFLALTCQAAAPVVVTGAQRAADAADADGPGNLEDAIRLASHPRARGLGVVVSFGGEVLSGWGVRKVDTQRLQPFRHASGGVLGRMTGGAPAIWARPVMPAVVPLPGPSFGERRVDLVASYPGADGALIDAAVAAGARGLVLLGAGAGNPGRRLVPAISRAADRGVLVALGTRTHGGPVVPIYGDGGAVDAIDAGAVSLGDVPATQARVLIALLLDRSTPEEASARLAEWTTT